MCLTVKSKMLMCWRLDKNVPEVMMTMKTTLTDCLMENAEERINSHQQEAKRRAVVPRPRREDHRAIDASAIIFLDINKNKCTVINEFSYESWSCAMISSFTLDHRNAAQSTAHVHSLMCSESLALPCSWTLSLCMLLISRR